jgi:hypothetical protein
MHAAAAATRGCLEDLQRRTPTRRLFLHLAQREGTHVSQLAAVCGITSQAVRMQLREPHDDLRHGDLCLGDARLRLISGVSLVNAMRAGRPAASHSKLCSEGVCLAWVIG